MAVIVTMDNFARAETDRMFAGLQQQAGGVNRWHHSRVPTPIDQQPVIRMNRDTLYSMALVDLSAGATLTMPDAKGRYLSVMVVNEDHYINRVFHDAGRYDLAERDFDTPYVLLAARILADPNDPADLAAAHAVQDGLALTAGAARPFVMPDYDAASFEATRAEVTAMSAAGVDAARAFGRREDVDPVQHRIGTAVGWGGLPPSEAVYELVAPNLPVGAYRIVVGDVPVDAFWSISVYNAAGFFEPNDRGVNSVNSVTATPNSDGVVTINLGGCEDGRPNCVPLSEGWNYVVRLYRPRPEVRDGSWHFPGLEPAS